MYFPTSSALIEFLILAVLEQDDSYGYEISQTIKLIANIKESTLYPILKNWKAIAFWQPILESSKVACANTTPWQMVV